MNHPNHSEIDIPLVEQMKLAYNEGGFLLVLQGFVAMVRFFAFLFLISISLGVIASGDVTKIFNKETGDIEWSVADRQVFTLETDCYPDRLIFPSGMYELLGWEEEYYVSCRKPKLTSRNVYADKGYSYGFNGEDVSLFNKFYGDKNLNLFLKSEQLGKTITLRMESEQTKWTGKDMAPIRVIEAIIDPTGIQEAISIQKSRVEKSAEEMNIYVRDANRKALIARGLGVAFTLFAAFLLRGQIRRLFLVVKHTIVGIVAFAIAIVVGALRLPFVLVGLIQRHRIQRIIIEEEIRAKARADAETRHSKSLSK
ncbi:hypothetical protein BCU68_13690 [Vibrio sp. 10N.286.49.B3]|uniref:hypothetical protein n=1 Tax=Vibrio sp. 10N.286.49.B3 TaxID=1880855 RepID=UPI000C8554A2|nr:hypothetical protein [Vibrio sp. 10N.286.49.B3]PMH42643.1 hypothetical protein BCU68_13690 [Vibrio sp. 10N.286.49.B3]